MQKDKDYVYRYPELKVSMPIKGVKLRISYPTDVVFIKKWLLDPETRKFFPCGEDAEISEVCLFWSDLFRYGCSMTAIDSRTYEPIGIATLMLQNFKKLKHTCDFSIVVAPEKRRNGVGSFLISQLEKMASEKFKIETLTLQVYEMNPAFRLYRRLGYEVCGNYVDFVKIGDEYLDKTLMAKRL